jgi:hypothetical protein
LSYIFDDPNVVKPPKVRLMYDLLVRWVGRFTLSSILGEYDNMSGTLGCVRCKHFLTQVP